MKYAVTLYTAESFGEEAHQQHQTILCSGEEKLKDVVDNFNYYTFGHANKDHWSYEIMKHRTYQQNKNKEVQELAGDAQALVIKWKLDDFGCSGWIIVSNLVNNTISAALEG